MKAFWIFITSIFVSVAAFGAVTAVFAQETKTSKEEKLEKVYYSESLGVPGETKVSHITSCQKIEAKAPLRCSEENKDKYKNQCIDNKTNKVRNGTIIKGCVTKAGDPDNIKNFYPEVKPELIDKMSPEGCKDDPARQSPYYVTEWAVVNKNKSSEQRDWILVGTVASEEKPSADTIKKISDQVGSESEPLYRTVLCTTMDVLEGKEASSGEPTGPITETQKAIHSEAAPVANGLIELGCNNSTSSITDEEAKEKGITISTPFNDDISVTCTTKYRIEGEGGVDIFSQYIGYLYKWAAGIVGIVAVFTIVYNGIIISASGGGETTEAKERIMQSLVGIAILFLAGLILYTINPGFFTS